MVRAKMKNDVLTAAYPQGSLDFVHAVERGLPVKALDDLAEAVAPGDGTFKHRVVPRATLMRQRKDKRALTVEQGNRVARVAKVFAMARDIFRDDALARAFLTRPHPMLDGSAPLAMALATGPGADAVENLLGRLQYGAAV